MATIRKNVVEHLYVAHCLVNGVGCNEYIRAETDTVARQKALSNLCRVYGVRPGVGDYEIVSVERIDDESSVPEDVM